MKGVALSWLFIFSIAVQSVAAGELPARVERSSQVFERVGSEDFRLMWKLISRTGLYVDPDQRQRFGEDLLNPRYHKMLLIEYGVGISAERFVELTRNALEDAWSPDELAVHRDDIDKLCSLYRDVGAGDRYGLYWIDGRGLVLELNNEPLGTIADAGAARMILSVWLGRAAVSVKHRDLLLQAWAEQVSSRS